MQADSAGEYRYRAFISYSNRDARVAGWLHRRLERYRAPRSLHSGQSARLSPVFRDRDELSASNDLTGSIHEALRSSENLIVICSPHAAQSRWVDREVREFKLLGRAQRIFALIVDGTPGASLQGGTAQECLPPALLFDVHADGSLSSARCNDILAADLRPSADDRPDAFLKLAAPLLGVQFDQLKRRDALAARRRLQIWAASLLGLSVLMATLAGIALWQRNVANAERERAEQALKAANAAASGLVHELAIGTKNWAGMDKAYVGRMLVRAQNVLLAALAAGNENNSPIQHSLGVVYSEMASLQTSAGDLALAQTLAAEALRMFETAYRAGYQPDQTWIDAMIARRKLGEILQRRGNLAEAVRAHERGLAFAERHAAERGKSRASTRQIAMTKTRLGMALGESSSERALAVLQSAQREFEELGAAALDSDGSLAYATNRFHAGRLLAQVGKSNEALAHLLESERLMQTALDASSDRGSRTDILNAQIQALTLITLLYLTERNVDAANTYCAEGILAAREVLNREGAKPEAVSQLALLYQLSGQGWELGRDVELAKVQYQKALDLRTELEKQSPNDAVQLLQLARLRLTLARLSPDRRIDALRAAEIGRRFKDHSAVATEAQQVIADAESLISGALR